MYLKYLLNLCCNPNLVQSPVYEKFNFPGNVFIFHSFSYFFLVHEFIILTRIVILILNNRGVYEKFNSGGNVFAFYSFLHFCFIEFIILTQRVILFFIVMLCRKNLILLVILSFFTLFHILFILEIYSLI